MQGTQIINDLLTNFYQYPYDSTSNIIDIVRITYMNRDLLYAARHEKKIITASKRTSMLYLGFCGVQAFHRSAPGTRTAPPQSPVFGEGGCREELEAL
jgi:hypothetical protein